MTHDNLQINTDHLDAASIEVVEYIVSMNGQKHKPQTEKEARALANRLRGMFPDLTIEVIKK